MAKFTIHALHHDSQRPVTMIYDNSTSELTDENGVALVPHIPVEPRAIAFATSIDNPAGKVTPKALKISLGLSCNYECEYCSQRFVPRATETNPDDIAGFIAELDSWVTETPEKIEFWGGEPLVYIKTLRPLAEALRAKFPKTPFTMITNGSLLTPELNEWIDRTGFYIGLSHDGPGQSVRGPDPLDDPEKKSAILDLYRRLAPQNRMSFNAMLNRVNTSRAAITQFFIALTGDPNVQIGEGTVVDAYDEGGVSASLRPEEFHSFRVNSFHEIKQGLAKAFPIIRERMSGFVTSLRARRPANTVGQKCGMDRPENIVVDLHGNVLTCQNVSITSTAPNGESHKIGHVSDLKNVKLKTATHWSHREECPNCPVLQICQGACMFLEGPLWETSCDNSFSDAITVFAAGIEFLTGAVPIYINGPQRDDRKDIFGLVVQNDKPAPVKKPFPIPVVAM